MSVRVASLEAAILGGVLAAAPSTHASSWTEIGDAGSLPATAQVPAGKGPLDTIVGTLGYGDVDVYEIRLTGGGTFSAAAVGAAPLFLDPQLFLFDSTGRGVYANNDRFPPDPSAPGGAFLPAGDSLTPMAPGIYFLAISSRDLEPVSSGGFIFPCVECTPGLVAGPSGPGGGSPITGWGGSPFTAGSYTITLTGAEFSWTDFYTLAPCRVFDTRQSGGPTLGAPLTCGTEQSFAVAGKCGVPSGAMAVSLNVTGTASTAQGNLRLFASGAPAPQVSSLNYGAGQTRANNAVIALGTSGQISVLCQPPSGTTHVVLDVNGYFQ